MDASGDGHVEGWPGRGMAMYRDGHVQGRPCTGMAM